LRHRAKTPSLAEARRLHRSFTSPKLQVLSNRNIPPHPVHELDAIADELAEPNLRGFLVRVPGSKFYREPPRGSADTPPSMREVKEVCQLARTRLDIKRRRGI